MNAPFSCPKNSLSSKFSGIAPQFTGTNGPLARSLEADAAEDLKRVRRPGQDDWLAEPTLSRLEQWTETKTVWHPIGV